MTPAEVVASLNSVITNLNGGAKASVSGARVSIQTQTQGDNARIEIYDGDVTAAMVWKRPPNTVMEPDVTVAGSSTPSNDLRGLADALNYSDPLVTRTAANITYQLDDVAGLSPGHLQHLRVPPPDRRQDRRAQRQDRRGPRPVPGGHEDRGEEGRHGLCRLP